MSLGIVLTEKGKVPIWNDETSVSFHEEQYYWYLYPTLIKQIQNQTGKVIDLYDDAEFEGGSLLILEKIVINQLIILEQIKEKSWEVHVGTQTYPEKKQIFETVKRTTTIELLEKLLHIVRLAIKQNEKIICLGD